MDSTQVISTIIYENSIWINLLYVILGCVAVLTKFMGIAIKKRIKKISGFWQFVKDDSLVIAYAYTCYLLLIALWWFVGIDFFGLYKGALTALTIPVGFAFERILATVMKEYGNGDKKQNGE